MASLRDCPDSRNAREAVEKLSAIQMALLTQHGSPDSPPSASRHQQQLLLSLTELQRAVTGSERHQERQQAVLEQYAVICEVMQAQLQNAGGS